MLLGYAAAAGRSVLPETAADRGAVLASGVFVVAGTGLTFLGQQYTTGGNAAIVIAVGPILTAAVAWTLLPGERPTRRDLVGLAVALAGVAVVVRPSPALGPNALLGNLLVLGAASSIALGSVLVRRVQPSMPVLAQTGWAMLLGGVLLLHDREIAAELAKHRAAGGR